MLRGKERRPPRTTLEMKALLPLDGAVSNRSSRFHFIFRYASVRTLLPRVVGLVILISFSDVSATASASEPP
jgi:hypothetical protein